MSPFILVPAFMCAVFAYAGVIGLFAVTFSDRQRTAGDFSALFVFLLGFIACLSLTLDMAGIRL